MRLLDLWEAQDSDKRWTEIEYVVRGDKFHASFTYPDEIDPEEDPFDRRDRIVAKHFGKKPIVYPPPPTIRHRWSTSPNRAVTPCCAVNRCPENQSRPALRRSGLPSTRMRDALRT